MKKISKRLAFVGIGVLLVGFIIFSNISINKLPEYIPATSTKYISDNKDEIGAKGNGNKITQKTNLEKFLLSDIDENSKKNFKEEILNNEVKNTGLMEFYDVIFEKFMENDPHANNIPKIEIIESASSVDGILTKESLGKSIKMSGDDIKKLQTLHRNVYESLPSKFPKGMYQGNGIVYVGGGQYSWLSLLSIKSLRSSGSQLPVEVIITSIEEYEIQFCEEVLPFLNAKCVLIPTIFKNSAIFQQLNFRSYQFKSLALIASSFQNVLLLDSDNILVTNPDEWFKQAPFTTIGMIIWPDYWKRTTSPLYYDIADIKYSPTKRARVLNVPYLKLPNQPKVDEPVPLHDLEGTIPDLSTESGQFLINKNNHIKTLLLSLYYNTYGPDYYYKLFSQGQQGEGDKDTFIAGAVKANEDFYQVKQQIRSFGHFRGEGQFNGVAMGQRDPVEDFKFYTNYIDSVSKFSNDISTTSEEFEKSHGFHTVKESKYATIHCNTLKLNPARLFDAKSYFEGDKRVRIFFDMGKFLGFDFELKQWKRMKFYLCDLNLNFKCFNDIKKLDLCQTIDEQLTFLIENPIT